MKNILKFIIFIIYTIVIFFIKSYALLVIVFAINLLLMFILKIKIKKTLQNICNVLGFIIFTVIINMIFGDFKTAILIGIRLLLVCNVTYIFSNMFTYLNLAEVIEKLCKPFEIFKINAKQISLIICIAVAFIPILQEEINQIKLSLKAKGNRSNVYKTIILMFQPFLINLFKRVNEIEESIKSKGWNLE